MAKEDKNMLEDYKKGKDEYQNLLSGANDQAVSTEERDKRKRQAEDKLKQLKDLEVTITQYENTARNTLMEQNDRMRANIISDIRNVVNAKAKASGFSMVIDTAAETINKTPVFLYTTNENDLTEAVLLQLNQNAPTDLSKTDDKLPADEKKKDGRK
jgi:Skp family chaperone for outer membrane proteins